MGGKLLLFFGARSKEELPYFGPLQNLPKDFIDTHFAFSRTPGQPKRYVQDVMRERAADLAPLLKDPNSYFYVCGLKSMEEGVVLALRDVAHEAGLNWDTLAASLKTAGSAAPGNLLRLAARRRTCVFSAGRRLPAQRLCRLCWYIAASLRCVSVSTVSPWRAAATPMLMLDCRPGATDAQSKPRTAPAMRSQTCCATRNSAFLNTMTNSSPARRAAMSSSRTCERRICAMRLQHLVADLVRDSCR